MAAAGPDLRVAARTCIPLKFTFRCRAPPCADMHRLRLDMQAADKERGRLESRLQAKEREIGGLTNKVCAV